MHRPAHAAPRSPIRFAAVLSLPVALLTAGAAALLIASPVPSSAAPMAASPVASPAAASAGAAPPPAPGTSTTSISAAPTKNLPRGIAYAASVEGIHEYRLDNGLRVLLFPDPSQETATVAITYFVGSRHEGYGETGMAHLLEHLMFKGTPRHPDIPNELTARGCRPNGSTWFDRTNYFETFAATEENLSWALDLEADRMVNSFISAEDLASEMTVVRNEFESGENNPRGILEERVYSTAYLWHNYGNTTIGARSDIENVPIERLRAFYRTWYRPDNAMLVVAGKIEPRRALELVAEHFGPLRRPETPVPLLYTSEPAQDGERTVTLRRVGDVQAVSAAYHMPAGTHPDYPAMAILAHIFGDTPSGRLHKALVETGMATSVSAGADRFADPGLFTLGAEVRVEKPLLAVRDELLAVAEGVADRQPAEEEVERARASLLSRWESAMRNSSRAAISLSDWAAMGDWRMFFVHRDRLRKVTPAQVAEAAARYLVPTNRTVGLFIPTAEPMRAEIPPTPDLAGMIGEYLGGQGLAQGEAFEATPENIETRALRETLPNGLKLILLPRRTRGETVNLSLQLHFGGEETLRGRAAAGDLAGGMLLRGSTDRTRQEIRDELDRLRAQLMLFGSAAGAFGGLETTREHLPAALRLLAEALRRPSFPEGEFELLKQERLARLEEARSDPRSRAFTHIRRHLNPYPPEDVRAALTPEEEIAAVTATTLAAARDFHRDFYGAGSGEIAVAGDFDPEGTRELLAELFGDWTAARPYERLVETYEDRPAILESIETPDKESAVFNAGLRLAVGADDPDYPALVLANQMTGGGFLNSRLARRIRGQEGLSYGVGSMLRASAWDRDGYFGAFAIYAPQNDARLLAAFREEIRRILDAGFTDEEIAEAKSGWLQRQTVSRSQNRELAQTLAERAFEGRTLAWDAAFERRIAELTAEEIVAAFRRHIRPEAISIVRAGDFARAPAGADADPAGAPPRGGEVGLRPDARPGGGR